MYFLSTAWYKLIFLLGNFILDFFLVRPECRFEVFFAWYSQLKTDSYWITAFALQHSCDSIWNKQLTRGSMHKTALFYFWKVWPKELSLWNKIKYLNLIIFRTRFVNLLCFKLNRLFDLTEWIISNTRSPALGCRDIGIRKSEFVAWSQLRWKSIIKFCLLCPQ